MKKTLISLLVFGLAFAFINAQSIIVTSPASGDNWYFDDAKRITWTKSGEQNGLVKIRLFNEAGIRVLSLTDSTNNDGLYEWTVPNFIPAGNYMIRVKTVDNLVWDDSNFFNISESFVSTGTITIYNPTSSTSFMVTQRGLSMSWGNIGDNHESVSIVVIPEGNPSGAMSIIASTPNDDDYLWRDPGSLTGAGRFYIRIRTIDGAVWGDSGIFEILPTTSPVVIIDVTSPDEGAGWNVGSPRMINWRVRGEMDDRVSIKLYDHSGSTLIRTIAANTDNDESEHWVVPTDHDAGRFVMKVTTIDNEVTGTSGIFNITRPDDPEDPPADTPASRNTIKVKFPNSSSVWSAGQKVNIVWGKNPVVHSKVRIELFRERMLRAVKVITSRTDNDGTFSWKIPAGITSGRHIIKITTLNNLAYGISKIFVFKTKRIIPRKK